MSRPIYETDKDRANQSSMIPLIETIWGMEVKELERLVPFDFELGNRQAFVEYKRRNITRSQYPTIMLSMKKLAHAKAVWPTPVYFLVQWNDGTGWVQLRSEFAKDARLGGRTRATRDQGDIETVAHIPTELFNVV
jgi:hypothetical protein